MSTTPSNPTELNRQGAYFGQWLRLRRIKLKRSLKDCSQASGYSIGMLSEIERGIRDVHLLAIQAIRALSLAYRIKQWALLRRMGYLDDDE